MGGTSLPPGFRFHPTDEELVGYYLKRKIEGLEFELEVIPVIDLYKFDPWELPDKSFLPKRDMEWFFFCPRDRKYPNGSRTNRVTVSGYWKATGKDRKVVCQSAVTGLRKTLVFYRGRAPLGDRTDWVMHEYRLSDDPSHQGTFSFQGGFALCRVVKKNDQGLKNKGDLQGEPRGKKVGETSVTGKITPTRLLNGLLSNTSSSNPVMSPCEIPTMKEFSSENLNKINPMNIWISPDLILDSSKDYQQAQVVADFFPHTDLQGSISPCHQSGSAGISPTSLYSNFIEEVEPIEDFGGISCLSSYTEPTKYMGLYGDEEMTYQSFEQTNLLSPYPLINGVTLYTTFSNESDYKDI